MQLHVCRARQRCASRLHAPAAAGLPRRQATGEQLWEPAPNSFTLLPGQELVQVESLAQVGVQLLLFTLGLEFSLAKLRAVRGVALLGGVLQVPFLILRCSPHHIPISFDTSAHTSLTRVLLSSSFPGQTHWH